MHEPTIDLKSISELQGFHFIIPSYQRGYRWGKTQVENLLNDIWDFHASIRDNEQKVGTFYCLQPLVVKKRNDSDHWEIIDGQQRLTTVYLVMKCFEKQLELIGVQPYKISFETRASNNDAYLATLDDAAATTNVDIYHMSAAVTTIREWFKTNRKPQELLHWLQTLTNNNQAGKNTRFIWYQIPQNEDPIDVFTRLNVGKIQLTNSELVRALFLSKSIVRAGETAAISNQLHIAENWDAYEQNLQKNAFWYFIHDGNNIPTNRIEYLFEQLTEQFLAAKQEKPDWQSDSNRIFHMYAERFGDSAIGHESSKTMWDEIRTLYLTLDEWYQDRTLYHLVGFLLNDGTPINVLRDHAQQCKKAEFSSYLKKTIYNSVFGNLKSGSSLHENIDRVLDTYSYQSSTERKKLRNILLLFNIATLLENTESNIRFAFDSFKKQKWDIEHIQPVADSRPERIEEQKQWVRNVFNLYCSNTVVSQKFQNHAATRGIFERYAISEAGIDDVELLFNNKHPDFFADFYNAVSALLGGTPSSDTIENLTLLDETTNRSIQNSMFPVKRGRILELDKGGTYIPLCTRNVFLKAYSSQLDEMLYWSQHDQDEYEKAIKMTLVKFFS